MLPARCDLPPGRSTRPHGALAPLVRQRGPVLSRPTDCRRGRRRPPPPEADPRAWLDYAETESLQSLSPHGSWDVPRGLGFPPGSASESATATPDRPVDMKAA